MTHKPKPRTATQQRAANADKHPEIKLVPDGATPPLDAAAGDHPKAGQKSCGASRWYQGLRVHCELKVHHAGDHSQQGRTWRPRSGDNTDA